MALFLVHGFLFSQDLENLAKQKPFKFNGSLAAFADFYAVDGIQPRSVPFNWRVTGSPTVHLYGISFPFYFNISQQNRSFAQPFNQFGVSPRYKWITLHGGWRSLSYSQYTLSGLMFLGGGVDLNPGKFRFSAMYGRFTRAVREDVANQFIQSTLAYQRKGLAAKIGVGTPQNYFDFIIFKAHDDSSSLPGAPDRVKPGENAVFGISSKFLIAKHIQITMDGAVSGYTRDTRIDIPEGDIYNRLRPVLLTNASTQLLTAANVSAGFVSKYFNIRGRYRRVDQDYKSMGTYIFETDVEAVTIEPSFNMLKGRVRVGGSIGQQHDNLLGRKMVTTDRTIGSLNISVNPSRVYGVDLQYGNYGIAQRAGVVAINDTVRLAIANQNFNLINRLSFINKTRAITIIMMNVYQEMRNMNPISPALTESTVLMANLNMNYAFLTHKTSVTAGFNYTQNRFALGDVLLMGPMLGVGKAFFNGKLSTNATAGFMINKFSASEDAGMTINANLSMNYRISKSHGLLASIRGVRNTANNPLSIPFSEGFFTFGYQMTLQ